MGMTIDEIIEELERTKDYPASDPASDESLDGAIDILRRYQKMVEIESTTKNDLAVDCISRQAVMDCFKKWQPYMATRLWDFEQELSDLPSVTPTRKKGKWISKPHVYGTTYCSECDFELKIDDTNYCPNCGADMREVEE